MLKDTDTSIYIDAFTYVKRSKNRQEIIQIIGTSRNKTPSEIKEEMGARFSLTSRVLSDLREKNIVECLDPEAKTGRVYYLTDLGLRIYRDL
ncbi:MAG: MarR family transcriptional regulator [Methanobrevibacter sp.]|nr:MarR family transcriptional regulator [Methanobrevibacter sp.]